MPWRLALGPLTALALGVGTYGFTRARDWLSRRTIARRVRTTPLVADCDREQLLRTARERIAQVAPQGRCCPARGTTLLGRRVRGLRSNV